MAKITYLVIALMAINLGLFFFTCADYEEGKCVPNSSIWTFLLSPSDITDSGFINIIFGSAIGLAALLGTIVTIGTYIFKGEAAIYAAMSVALLGPIINSWIKYYSIISGSSMFGDALKIMAIMFIGPILIYLIFNLVDWARGKD